MPAKNSVNSKKSNKEAFKKNKLEWSVFALSSLLLLCLVGYLSYETFTHKVTPPDLHIKYTRDTANHNSYSYNIYLENRGGETAEDVFIEAYLLKKDSVLDRSELQIAFSPKKSKREGWINFKTTSTEADSIQIKVVSYKLP